MAYALALEAKEDFENGDILLVMALFYAIFTILFIGGILSPVISRMNVGRET